MKKLSALLGFCWVFGFTVSYAQAATVEVEFTDPDKYVDIRSGEKHSKHFRDDVFYNVEKQLKKLAKDLPEEQVLMVKFTDMDLAGDIRMSHGRLMRVVTQMYAPRLAFSYELVDKDKNILKQGEENIRNTSFMSNQSLRYRNDALGFEKHLLEKWFDEAFEEKLITAK